MLGSPLAKNVKIGFLPRGLKRIKCFLEFSYCVDLLRLNLEEKCNNFINNNADTYHYNFLFNNRCDANLM